jgi:hypothetical protein
MLEALPAKLEEAPEPAKLAVPLAPGALPLPVLDPAFSTPPVPPNKPLPPSAAPLHAASATKLPKQPATQPEVRNTEATILTVLLP